MTSDAARNRQRHQRKSCSPGGHQDRREALFRPAQDERRPERLALFALEVLEVADHQDPVSSRDAEHGQEPDQRAEREDTATQPHREHPAHQRHRQGQEEHERQAQAREGGLQEGEDRERRSETVDEQVLLRGGQLGGLSQHLVAVPMWVLDSRDACLDLLRDGAEILSLRHVGTDIDPVRLVLALHDVRGRRGANVCHLLQANLLASRCINGKLAYLAHAVAGLGRAPHVHVVGLAAPEDIADFFARDQRGRLPAHVARRYAVAFSFRKVHLHRYVRHALLEGGVRLDDAIYVLDLAGDLVRLAAKHFEVGTGDTHDDGLGRARQRFLDGFPQIRLHVAIETGVAIHGIPDGGHGLVVVDLGADADPVLAEVHAMHLLPQHGLPYVGSAVAYSGDLAQVLTSPNRHPHLFRSRRTGLGHPMHEEVPLLEVRKQGLPERWRHHDAGQHDDGGGGDRGPRCADDARQASPVAALEHPQEGGFLVPLPSRQEEQAQRRCDGQGDEHRHEHSQPVGEHERPEERPGEPPQKEDRHYRDDVDQRRVGDRGPHLHRGIEHDGERRAVASLRASLPETPYDILHVDDRIVHHDAYGDDEPREDHRVDGGVAHHEHDHRPDHRQRDRDQADERGAPLEEERGQDQNHEQDAEQQRRRKVLDRHLDEGGRAEDRRVYVHAGEAGAHLVDGLFDAPRNLHGVGVRELLNDQHQAGAVVDDGLTGERLVTTHHVPHVAEAHFLAVSPLDRHLGEVLRGRDRLRVAYVEPLAGRIDETAGPDHRAIQVPQQPRVQGARRGVHDLLQRDVVLGEHLRIHPHVFLRYMLTPDVHVRDAGHAQQALPDLPVGDLGHLDQAQLVRRKPDLHGPTSRREKRHYVGRGRPGRQRGRGRRQALLHHLPRVVDVGSPLEDELYGREVGNGCGAHVLEPLDPVELLLQWNRDQLLDLLRGVAKRDGLDLHARRRELRVDVHGSLAALADAEDYQRRPGEDHQPPEPQARCDDPTHQLSLFVHSLSTPTSVPYTSSAPVVTTLVPAGGPSASTTRSPSMRSTLISFLTKVSGLGLV